MREREETASASSSFAGKQFLCARKILKTHSSCKMEIFRYKHIFALAWFHKDLWICCCLSHARSWILPSVLQDTSVIPAVTRPFCPQNQTRKRRAHLNIALLIAVLLLGPPILWWCYAGSCSVQWWTQAAPGAAEGTVLLLSFPLKNDLALWHGPQAWSLDIPLTCHSPACWNNLAVQDTLHQGAGIYFPSYSFPLG